ncbi:MAG: tripartite tricarboxylate transporter substrate-binding protein [Ramlibacter sp.]
MSNPPARGDRRIATEESTLASNLPTLAESGVPGHDAWGWFAIPAPAGTPAAIIARQNAEIAQVLGQADLRAQYGGVGLEPLTSTPEQLAQLIRTETVTWTKVIKESGAKLD